MRCFLSKICILILLLICTFIATACGQGDESINTKQWYLENTGDAKYISKCEEYNQYITMEEDVDIDYREMAELFDGKDIGEEVVVALLDTGVDFNHDGLHNAMWILSGQINNEHFDGNFAIESDSREVSPSTQKTEIVSHGTGCAGIISAKINDAGIAGIASTRNVKILSVNITNDSASFTSARTEDLISAIKFAELSGSKICNISFSTADYSKELEEVIRNSSMLFVVSAGNGEPLGYNIDKHMLYPASLNLENLITVANLNYTRKLNRSSNFGEGSVDIAVPGTCIYTTAEDSTNKFRSGTSIAALMVAAVASVIFSIDNGIPASEVKNIIVKNSDYYPLLDGKVQSSGSLNAYKAVEYAISLYGNK